jgi:hypothetical protein
MKPKLTDPPPAEVLEIQRDFDVWRSAHSRRTPFPDALWAAAAKVATQYGIYTDDEVKRLSPSMYDNVYQPEPAWQAAQGARTAQDFVERFSIELIDWLRYGVSPPTL